MRKSILAMFVVMIAIFAVACGGNTAKGNGGDANAAGGGGGGGCTAKADPYALYKKGRSWTLKSVSKMGDTETISYTKTDVVDNTDKEITIKTTTMDKEKKETYSGESKIPKATEAPAANAPKVEAPKQEDGGEVEAAGKKWKTWKTVSEANGMKTTTWSSQEYPGLMIKSESEGEAGGMKMKTTMMLEEFKD